MRQFNRDPNAAQRKIFNQNFLYSIPALYRYSDRYNAEVGHISTGDRREDEKLMNEPVHIGGTIADLLKLFNDGVPVTFRYPKDITEVYETLQEHLNNWVEYIDRDPNVKNAPIESLQLMQEYMDAIYHQAKGFQPASSQGAKLEARNRMLFGGLSRSPQQAKPETPVEVEQPRAPALMDRLNRLLESRNR